MKPEEQQALAVDNDSLRMGEATRTLTGDHESRVSDTGTSIVQPAVCKTLSAEGYDGMPDPVKQNGMPIVSILTGHSQANGSNVSECGAAYTVASDGQAAAMCVDADPKVVQSAGFMIGPSAKTGSIGAQVEESPTLDTNGTKGVAIGVFNMGGNKASAGTDMTGATPSILAQHGTDPHAVAIGCDRRNQSGCDEVQPALQSTVSDGGSTVAVGVDAYNQATTGGASKPLGHSATDTDHTPAVALNHIVRRLTPGECETLQGFPRDWTKIPYRNKPADQCPDSPRFRGLGNSWATNCAEWILRRIVAADRLGLIP